MLKRVNRLLEKFMPVFIPLSLVLGVLFADSLAGYQPWVPWIFALMTFIGSLNSNFGSVKESVSHPLPILLVMGIVHLVMPVIAFAAGHLIFGADVLTITGLVLAMAIPTGITSFIWTVIYKGHSALSLTIILLSTLLSPLLVPMTMTILVGQQVEMDVLHIFAGLVYMIVLPSLAGMLLNQLTRGKIVHTLGYRLAPFSKIGLASVVLLNGAVVAPYLKEAGLTLVFLGVIVFLVALSGYALSFFTALLFRQDRETAVTMTYTGGMRNISAGVVIAVAYFPPPVALPVVLGMLFQQVIASLFGLFMTAFFRRSTARSHSVEAPVKNG